MDTIKLVKIDDVYLKIIAEPGIKMELSNYFTFEVPGYKFTPSYRDGSWDGKIRLFNSMTGRIYTGLLGNIFEFCKKYGYKIDIDPELKNFDDVPEDIAEGLAELYNTSKQPRYYQSEAVYHALKYKRSILLSATSSGKSFIIYLIVRYLIDAGERVLIVVPTTSLVRQMYKDFLEYNNGEPLPFETHQIEGGVSKKTKAELVISTWQSIYKEPAAWFSQFGALLGDECHTFKAKSLQSIMEKMPTCPYKIGFTGTLDGAQCNELVLQGLFGKSKLIVDVATLMNDGTIAKLKVKSVLLSHTKAWRKALSKNKDYQEEINYLITNTERNNIIKNIAWNAKGNTLILFDRVEDHGKVLFDLIQKEGKKVFFVSGKDSTDYREEVRKYTELNSNVIIIASFGIFKQGINIVNLDNLIFASPSKARIKILQSIGRILRKSANNIFATLYDIGDDISHKSYKNHTLRHFEHRIKMYAMEGFEYELVNIEMKLE